MLSCDVRITERTKDGCPKINTVAMTDMFDRKLDTNVLRFFSTGKDDK